MTGSSYLVIAKISWLEKRSADERCAIFMLSLRNPLLFACSLVLFAAFSPAAPPFIAPSDDLVSDYPPGLAIPNAQDAPTGKQFCPIYEAWAHRSIVDEYDRSHPGDANVSAFLNEAVLYLVAWNGDFRS